LEMIHTYSLIHEDLPAMDNDDFRRGKPTCHKVYGESLAILAGDGLLTQAFAVMAEQQGDAHRVLKAIKVVSQQAGLLGMVAGQAADVACAGQEIDEDLLRYIYRGKTAALFAASILSAAYLAGAGQEKLVVLEQYSTLLGYAFQITDDVLDIRGDAALLGKPLGSDAKNAKTTFATLLGCDQAIVYADALAKQAGDVLADFGADAELLRQMPGYLCGRTK
ncbi:MAG: polyprenyl synthetase family protein, partial [Clostridiales bacterium]